MEKKIYSIIEDALNNDKKIFALTGDLDRLGIFVAKNGRSKAENLVDRFNIKIECLLKEYFYKNSIKAVLHMAGEEIFAIGCYSPKNKNLFNELKEYLNNSINPCLKELEFSSNEDDVTISFGLIDVDLEDCRNLLKNHNEHEFYLFLQTIREKLALSLDESKFSDLNITNNLTPVFYRNIVYYKMLKYKQETNNLIKKFSKKSNEFLDLSIINKNYGLDEDRILFLEELIKNIK